MNQLDPFPIVCYPNGTVNITQPPGNVSWSGLEVHALKSMSVSWGRKVGEGTQQRLFLNTIKQHTHPTTLAKITEASFILLEFLMK